MPTKGLKSILMLAFVAIILFASGCTEENLSAEEIVTQMLDKQNSTEDYSYTMYMTSYAGGKTAEIEYKTMFKKPNMSKDIIPEPGKKDQIIIVSDGEFAWSYIPATNEVIKMELPDIPEPTKSDCINAIGEFLNSTNVTLLRVENIDGRTAYLLETSSKEKDGAYPMINRTKIWVDKETWMPLRYEMYDGDGNLTAKIEIRDLKVNSGIPDSEFKFEIPDGAEVKTLDIKEIKSSEKLKEIKSSEKPSPEEAREKTSF